MVSERKLANADDSERRTVSRDSEQVVDSIVTSNSKDSAVAKSIGGNNIDDDITHVNHPESRKSTQEEMDADIKKRSTVILTCAQMDSGRLFGDNNGSSTYDETTVPAPSIARAAAMDSLGPPPELESRPLYQEGSDDQAKKRLAVLLNYTDDNSEAVPPPSGGGPDAEIEKRSAVGLNNTDDDVMLDFETIIENEASDMARKKEVLRVPQRYGQQDNFSARQTTLSRNERITQSPQIGAVHHPTYIPASATDRNTYTTSYHDLQTVLGDQPSATASNGEQLSSTQLGPASGDIVPGGSTLLSATLVDEEAVVEAEQAYTGFRAILYNKRFKYLLFAFICLLIVVTIPVAIVARQSAESTTTLIDNTTTTIVNPTSFCGTAKTNQADYRGSINISDTGVACQRWDSQYPNSHPWSPDRYPTSGLDDNYCRNPDGDIRPWCIVDEPGATDKRYCSVPFCDGEDLEVNTLLCGTLTGLRQTDYRGTINTTFKGAPCVPWEDWQYERYPNTGLEANYCRNPLGRSVAFCNVGSGWDYCGVPICEVLYDNSTSPPEDFGSGVEVVDNECGSPEQNYDDYRGFMNSTETGHTCQRWDSQEPHQHARTKEEFPDADLIGNYCRNPDNKPRPWCYTTDPEVRWGFCDVPACKGEQEGLENESCGTKELAQTDYRGSISVTQSGFTCQRWDAQEPHEHSRTASNYPTSGLEANYCRNPDHEPRAWCYTTDPDKRWEYCDVEYCQLYDLTQCGTYDWKQRDYVGTKNTTKSGITCQAWSAQEPHYHYELPALLPEENLIGNYCRNPTTTGDDRAWCYTMNPDIPWEYCDINFCTTEEERQKSLSCGSRDLKQNDYRGSIAVTVSGHRCQRWDAQFPKSHRGFENIPALEENYCRNPDGELDTAWCLSSDITGPWREPCDVPFCDELEGAANDVALENECTDCDLLDCGSYSKGQWDYRGSINVTAEGIPCQAWSVQEPHAHSRRPEDYPEANLTNNYCRNPDGDSRAWCYTTDNNTRWSLCAVPYCSEPSAPENNTLCIGCNTELCGTEELNYSDYRGSLNTTLSGETCQSWDSQYPHQHPMTPEVYSLSGLSGNHNACRNPDGKEGGAWCFTTNPYRPWEYCNVNKCG